MFWQYWHEELKIILIYSGHNIIKSSLNWLSVLDSYYGKLKLIVVVFKFKPFNWPPCSVTAFERYSITLCAVKEITHRSLSLNSILQQRSTYNERESNHDSKYRQQIHLSVKYLTWLTLTRFSIWLLRHQHWDEISGFLFPCQQQEESERDKKESWGSVRLGRVGLGSWVMMIWNWGQADSAERGTTYLGSDFAESCQSDQRHIVGVEGWVIKRKWKMMSKVKPTKRWRRKRMMRRPWLRTMISIGFSWRQSMRESMRKLLHLDVDEPSISPFSQSWSSSGQECDPFT